MRFGSVCSGIEAASVAWHPLGWKAAWLSEIEPFPSAVLAQHYPDVPNLGDMTTLPDRIASGEVEAPDLFCGGTPCQAFSVAGLRQSLDDARGNLSLTFCEIANAIDQRRRDAGSVPAIIFWENVPGVLSTKDNAFGCFLSGLAGEETPMDPPRGKWTNAGVILGPQRAVAWRILDAQYFGVAQRRRRVFVVASARDDFDPASVLLEFDGVRRDTAPRRETGKVAPTIPSRSTAGGGLGTDFDLDGGLLRVAGTLTANTGGMTRPAGNANELDFCVPMTVAHGQGGAEIAIDRAPTLTCNHEAPIAFHPTQDPISSTDGTTHGLGCGSSGGQASVAVATPINTQMETRGPDTSNTPREGLGLGEPGDPAFTLQAAHHHAVQMGMAVRRLTPVECERLQGFPDGYTDIPWTEYQRLQKRAIKAGTSFEAELRKHGKVLRTTVKECPDSPRYKALGNSWAVPVVRWIGSRIHAAVMAPANDNFPPAAEVAA